MCTEENVLMPSPATLTKLANDMKVSEPEVGYLYRKADRILKTWYPVGAPGEFLPLSKENFRLAMRLASYAQKAHPDLELSPEQLFNAVGIFNEQFLMRPDTATEDVFNNVAEECLELSGLLDTPGDCPICGKGGYASAPRHHVCTRLILTKARFKCRCGADATNFYNWRPICARCEQHEAHLDSLCD